MQNPHDRFGRKYLQNVKIASDILRYYADPLVLRNIDIDHLRPAPTHGISRELKEVIMDVSYLARLREVEGNSEVLFAIEHKSQPSPFAALQLGTQSLLNTYTSWTDAGYPDAGTFRPAIPLMIVIYNGQKDWPDSSLWFQAMYGHIPPELRIFIPQFKVQLISLRNFQYENLQGCPETKAFVESLKRASDGTFVEWLGNVFRHINEANLEKSQRWDFVQSTATYCYWTTGLTGGQLSDAISHTFTREEGKEMLETLPEGLIRDGYILGEIENSVKSCLSILNARFNTVPSEVVDSLKRMTDLTALESLVVLAATCENLNEFAEALK